MVHRGQLLVDSLVFRDLHFTQIRGPLRLEESQILLGVPAEAQANAAGLPRSVTARVFDGQLSLDGWLGVGDDRRFEVYAALNEGQLARIASETGVSTANISGRAFATMRLEGQAIAQ